MRGDHTRPPTPRPRTWGRPPRARGPRRGRRYGRRHRGTTPACAGTTALPPWSPTRTGDHPRVCRDHVPQVRLLPVGQGPPPRVRGPLHDGGAPLLLPGTTPACAGTTVCGGCPGWPAWGPPPRARGPRVQGSPVSRGAGTTPACAGTTCAASPRRTRCRDHPRVRGDHLALSRKELALMGPPPRARGPLRDDAAHDPPRGTTPACAGTTWPATQATARIGDHPRVRGDHSSPICHEPSGAGPPPRARGPLRPGRRP